MVKEICIAASNARYEIQALSEKQKNTVLLTAADLLLDQQNEILKANEEDVERAVQSQMKSSMVDRLRLTSDRIAQMAEGLRQVATLPDPIGEVLSEFDRPSGIHVRKVRVPIGVIGIIYESRPNVTADAFALTFKSGNVAVLKGGSDAICSNIAITKVLRNALSACNVSPNAVSLIESTDRADTNLFMQMREYIDVLIPRGSAGLIRAVVENSKIPVIETGSGNCCIYVDETADFEKAIPIIVNAKTQRTGVCNAAESLLVHEKIASEFLPILGKAMKESNVELHADAFSLSYLEGSIPATEEDYETEYLDLKMSVKTVTGLQEAIEHINKVHTGHSDCILTEDEASATLFTTMIDSACVYVNTSTRFTDGFEFGFGAEIGISTQKLHARGPMGLTELTSYKYLIDSNGAVRKG